MTISKLLKLLGLKDTILFLCIAILCVVLAFVNRSRFYWAYPPVAATFDEFASGWLGLSLVKDGIPTSWSFIPDYGKGVPVGAKLYLQRTQVSVNGILPTKKNFTSFPKPILHSQEFELDGYRSQFNIVTPYLEQPPLGGLIISLPLLFSGKTEFAQVSVRELRKPFLVLGALGTLLVIALANLWYGRQVALVSGLLYATVPTVVLGSRLALPENILVILFLTQIFLLELYKKNKSPGILKLTFLIAFISPLIKPFGITAAIIGIAYYLLLTKRRNPKIILGFILAGALSAFIYIWYGFSFDKGTFLAVLSYQSQRFFAGPHTFLLKVLVPRITLIFLDGWVFFGWIALFVLALAKENTKHLPLLIGAFSYLLTIILFGGEDFGWYRLPLYPFLLIAAGFLIVEIIKMGSIFPSLLFLGTGIASSFAWGLGIYKWSENLTQFRIFLIAAVGLLALRALREEKNVHLFTSGLLLLIFAFSLFLNIRTISNMWEIWPLLKENSALIIGRQ